MKMILCILFLFTFGFNENFSDGSEIIVRPLIRRWWLTKNLRRMQKEYGEDEYNFYLPLFVLPRESSLFREEVEKQGEFSYWTMRRVKSRRMTSNNVELITDWNQLKPDFILEEEDTKIDGKKAIIQKILSSPMLVNGKQIHIQFFVALTNFTPLRLYLYQDTIKLSFKTPLYDKTDNCESDNEKDGEPCHEGDEVFYGSINSLQHHFKDKQIDDTQIVQEIENVIIKTVLSAERKMVKLSHEHFVHNFNPSNVLSFDLTFDETGSPWLNNVRSLDDIQNYSQVFRDWLIMLGVEVPPKVSSSELISLINDYDSTGKYVSTEDTVSRAKKRPQNEQEKRWMFAKYFHSRETYLDQMLRRLTREDIQQLTEANNELSLSETGKFKRIFPSSNMNMFMLFLTRSQNMYYYKLLDAWETKFSTSRALGDKLLEESSTQHKIHDQHKPHDGVPSTYNFLKGCSTSKLLIKEERGEL